MEETSWLILGGCGYIGRNLVKHLQDHGFKKITVADKKLPEMSFMHPVHLEAFVQVNMIQTDLSRNAEKAFTDNYSYIVNCCGESRSGMPERYHQTSTVGVVEKCLEHLGSSKWIEISSAKVYKSSKKPSTEEAQVEPWTIEAQYSHQAEGILPEGALILRPALVYGNGDISTVTPRAVLAAVYKHMNKKMKVLWGKDLRINTLHITDLCNSVLHLKDQAGVFNLVDDNDTTQEKLNRLLKEIFGIKYSYFSKTLTSLASLQTIAEEANSVHMQPWAEICGELESPISPFVEEENLKGNHLCISNQKLKSTGFELEFPVLDTNLVTANLNFSIEAGVLPNIINT